MAGAVALINNPPTITMLSLSALSPAIFGESAVTDKIDMKLLYAGHPGSDRQQDVVRFLKLRFVEVQTCDLATISEEVAGNSDVVILDYDQGKHPRPRFPNDYGVPTITMNDRAINRTAAGWHFTGECLREQGLFPTARRQVATRGEIQIRRKGA